MSYTSMNNEILGCFEQNKEIIHCFATKNTKYIELKKKQEPSVEDKKEMEKLKQVIDKYKAKYIFSIDDQFRLVYPGYKTKLNKEKIIYDYRVDFKFNNDNIPVSHPAIIIDLYNKVKQYPKLAKRWKEFLVCLAIEGDDIDLNNFKDLAEIEYNSPSYELIEQTNKIFNNMGRGYLANSNMRFNFTIQQLKILISWVALQEDINYPLSTGRFQGRKMPYYRYIEALYVGLPNARFTLEDVIKRALIHKQPPFWKCVNYADIQEIIE